MRVIQASWDPRGELYLWAESGPRFRKFEEASDPEAHPFAASLEELRADLEFLDLEVGRESVFSVLLPSNGSPLPSFKTAPEIKANNAPLKPWNVPAIAYEPALALAVLTSLPLEPPKGLIFDDSVMFWVESTKLLLDLLTRGRFLPSLRREGAEYAARWRITMSEPKDEERAQVLVSAMPLLSRAGYRFSDNSELPDAQFAFDSYMEKCADALIRVFLRRFQLLPGAQRDSQRSASLLSSWAEALTSADAEVHGNTADLLRFESRLRSWAAPVLALAKRVPLILTLHLRPPPDEESGWIVEFGLQAKSDSKQFLSAAEIWQGNLGFLKHSEHTLEEIEEVLLRELGRSVHFFPEAKRALSELQPAALRLTTEEAYSFLHDKAAILEQAGFSVVLPSWWGQRLSQLGLTLKVATPSPSSSRRSSSVGLNELLDYSWKIALGDRSLSEEEFRSLVQSGKPLVFLHGQWVELQPAKLKATVKFLERHKKQPKMRVLDALRWGFMLREDSDILPVAGLEASGWLQQLLEASAHGVEMQEQPGDFHGTLRPYQLEGLSWLTFLAHTGVGGCLADDMGLGKTIQLLALLLQERSRPEPVLPTLLIVPMSILGNWENEAKRFAPSLRVHLHHGPARSIGEAFKQAAEAADLMITTYSLAQRDEASLALVNWGRIALDEAQNIKNLSTKQTKAIRRLTFSQMTRDSDWCQRVALTGTPLENHLEELWSIFDFLNPNYLGDLADFRRRFAIPIERYRSKEASDALSRLIRPFILRRVKSDPKVISDLPEKIEMDEYSSLSPEQAALYQTVLDEMMPQVEVASGIHRKGLVLTAITRLKQICNHPALYLGQAALDPSRSGKLQRLEEILEILLDEGDKALIFSQFAKMGALLQGFLRERFNQEVLFLHGGLSRGAREEIVRSFQTKDGPRIFVLSLKAGGFGLNLTEANQVVHFDQWWNPAVQQQATDRAYRIGQKRSVQVRNLLCKGTLEERIASLLTQKRELVSNIIGTSRNVITELSGDELKELLSLQHEAGNRDEW